MSKDRKDFSRAISVTDFVVCLVEGAWLVDESVCVFGRCVSSCLVQLELLRVWMIC